MIRKAAIDQFLARKLSNYDWLKRESSARLDQALNELSPKPDLGKTPLWAHQQIAFLLLNELRRFMLHIDMGGGKSNICLAVIKYRKQVGDQPRAIVFVPFLTSVSTWIEQVAEHTPDLVCVPLLGTTASNLDQLQNTPGDLFVMCYASAVAMLSESVPAKNGKNEWKINQQLLKDTFQNFTMLIMDEVHKTKNIHALTYKMCRAISARCDWVIGLTGTPFNKDPIDLWAQFNLIDFGETLGPTLSFYREVFFTNKRNYWGGFEYKFKQKLLPTLQNIIKHSSISYGIEELHDMPPRKFIVRRLGAEQGQLGYAKAAIKRIREAANESTKGSYQVIESTYLQLRQISSGFMTLKGQNNDRLQVKFDPNPKLEALIDLIEAMPADRRMVVFHHFIFSNHLISEELSKLKIGHARIWSGQRDPLNELKRFKNDPKCRVLVINDQIGSTSLNLQFANYLVFFEQPDSAITRQQAERRVWRPGQKLRVFTYDLFVNGTYDEAMWKANKAGENLLQKLLRSKP